MRTLANRLSVYVLHDLAKTCPRTVLAVEYWLDQCAFWLTDLSTHPASKDQVSFMIGLLGLSMSQNLDWPLQDACRELKDQLQLHQLNKELPR